MNKNKKSNKSLINPKNFKFKIYWVYILIFLFFVGIQMIGTEKASPTNWKNFNNKMLQEGKVEKLTIVNKEKVFIYIKKEYLSEEQFKNVSKTPIGNSQNLV